MRLIRSIKLENLLSFGPESEPLELESLNLLIGPNASGKSNFIDAISLLKASPETRGMMPVIREGGGVQEWLWKGAGGPEVATIEALFEYPKSPKGLVHSLSFNESEEFRIVDERVGRRTWSSSGVAVSVLSSLRDPKRYPEIYFLTSCYDRVQIYREWTFGRKTILRQPQRADLENSPLRADFSNLGLVLSRLQKTPKVKAAILERLKHLYEGVTDFLVNIEHGGFVQISLIEGDFSVPATRLSDGTLRYLCLLAILCDPKPAPLICIEEPELGLHPDIVTKVADLLVEASQRTQLIVTTHSDVLVDAMTDRPEAVVVCEKREGQTQMHRLSKMALKGWLDEYRLGRLWSMGEIGGNRW